MSAVLFLAALFQFITLVVSVSGKASDLFATLLTDCAPSSNHFQSFLMQRAVLFPLPAARATVLGLGYTNYLYVHLPLLEITIAINLSRHQTFSY